MSLSHQHVSLDPTPEDVREWGRAAIETIAQYLSSIRDRRVYPDTTSQQIRAQLERGLPASGTDFEHLLASFRDVLIETSRQNAHPRMFGYVQSPGTAVAAIADLLASALNANLTAWRSAPAAVELERLTVDWIKQIVGFPPEAAGLFVSGGSIANLAAVAAARHTRAPSAFAGKGGQSVSRAMRIYASAETHHSIAKAAVLLGIGHDNVRNVRVDQRFKVDIDDLVTQISADFDAGHLPFCIVANAGTVMTGAMDPLPQLVEVARQFNLWLHVDASYGGFGVLAPSARPLFHGLEHADSIALDPHKWLYLPVDCGCVLYRDANAARATFAHDAAYTRVIGQESDEAFAFWDYGPELSRRFRALKVWMLLKGVGLDAIGRSIEDNIACAHHLERLVQESDDFEMLAPVELSIFCFRHVPAPLKNASEKEIDDFNERLLVALQRDGSSYLSNALLRGRFALRGCVMNYRTTSRDMEILLEDVRRVGKTCKAATS